MWLIPTVVQQKITQHYKAIILHAPPPPPKKKNTEEIQSSRVYKVYPFALEQAQALSHLEIGGGKKAKERLCFWVCEPNSQQQNNSTLPPIVLSYSQKLWPLSANAGNNHVLYTSRNSNRNTTKSLFFYPEAWGDFFLRCRRKNQWLFPWSPWELHLISSLSEEALDLATLNYCLDKIVSIMVIILYLFSNITDMLKFKKDTVQCLSSYYERIHFFF